MIKKHYLPMLMLGGLLCVLPLAACDNGEEPAADQDLVQNTAAPTADETVSSMPAPPAESAPSETVADAAVETPAEKAAATEGSMAEDSPAGEAVTEQEIPHSDVPPPSREVFTDADCDFEEWVGTQVDEAKVKEAGRPYRLLKPDSMMTMDHNPERVNVVHDDDMKITRVWCG